MSLKSVQKFKEYIFDNISNLLTFNVKGKLNKIKKNKNKL